jgi:hypothetical protein
MKALSKTLDFVLIIALIVDFYFLGNCEAANVLPLLVSTICTIGAILLILCNDLLTKN